MCARRRRAAQVRLSSTGTSGNALGLEHLYWGEGPSAIARIGRRLVYRVGVLSSDPGLGGRAFAEHRGAALWLVFPELPLLAPCWADGTNPNFRDPKPKKPKVTFYEHLQHLHLCGVVRGWGAGG